MDDSELWGEDPAMKRLRAARQQPEAKPQPKTKVIQQQKICTQCGQPMREIGDCQAVCLRCGQSSTSCDVGGKM